MARTKRYVSEEQELRRWRDGLDQALRKQRKSRVGGFLKGLAIILALFVLAAGGGALYFYKNVSGKVGRIDDLNLEEPPPGAMNMLVIGSDTREGAQTKEDIRKFGKVDGRRADTIILLQAVPAEHRAVLVHFPRDLWVPIAGRRTAKINSSYEAGPQTVIDTVQQLSGVPITHYVEVNINGFRNIVNAIGGIDVCMDKPLRDSVLNFRMGAGVNRLGGDEALSFVRSRHSDPDGDFGRIRRQQQFLRAVTDKVGRKSTLLNPVKLNSLADAFAKNVKTDTNLSLGEMVKLARSVRSVSPEQLTTYTVPGDVGRAGSQSVVLMDRDRADLLFGALREVKDPAQAMAPAPVNVRIDDASGKGLAQEVAAELTSRGFIVSGMANIPTVQKRTDVRTPRLLANDARRLVGVVPNARLLFGGTEIHLVLGSTFTGLVKPPVGEGPVPTGPCANFKQAGL